MNPPEIEQGSQKSVFICVHLDCKLHETEFIDLEKNLEDQFSNNWGFDNFFHSKNFEEKICLLISSNVRFGSNFYRVLTNALDEDASHAFYFDYEIEAEDQAQLLPEWSPFRFIGRDYLGPVIAIRENNLFSERKVDREFLSAMVISGKVIPKLIKQISYTQLGPAELVEANKRINLVAQTEIYADLKFSVNELRGTVEVHFKALSPEKISVVIPTRGKKPKNSKTTYLESCLESIYRQEVDSSLVEIIIVYDTDVSIEYLNDLPQPLSHNFSLKFIPFENKFNFSEKCNLGAAVSSGISLVFLNDDVEFVSLNSLSELTGASMFNKIGAVGTKLTYPDGKIQHGGIIKTDQGFGHAYIGSENNPGNFGDLEVCHEVTAVTGACLSISKNKFNLIGGWDEYLSSSYNDVALCLASSTVNFKNLILNSLEIKHVESATRISITLQSDIKHLQTYSNFFEVDEKFLRDALQTRSHKRLTYLKRLFIMSARTQYLILNGKYKEAIAGLAIKLKKLLFKNDRI